MLSNLEHAEEFLLQGWAVHQHSPDTIISLDIWVNGKFISRVPASTFRSDLQASGYGDGYHAFFFNPFDSLLPGQNVVEVRESASAMLIEGGRRIIISECKQSRKSYHQAQRRSQQQWVSPGPQHGGAGEQEFLRRLKQAAHFHPALNILEIGCGNGVIFEALLQTEALFGNYLGMDLCREAVDALHLRHANAPRVRFLTADAARYPLGGGFQMAFASSVCDAMFPSFLALAQNTRRVLTPGGLFCFDLVVQDDRASISRALWDGNNFLRFYSEAEVRRLLATAGLELLQLEIYEKASNEHRAFVTACRPHQPQKIKFGNL